jgi:hypothetical protein
MIASQSRVRAIPAKDRRAHAGLDTVGNARAHGADRMEALNSIARFLIGGGKDNVPHLFLTTFPSLAMGVVSDPPRGALARRRDCGIGHGPAVWLTQAGLAGGPGPSRGIGVGPGPVRTSAAASVSGSARTIAACSPHRFSPPSSSRTAHRATLACSSRLGPHRPGARTRLPVTAALFMHSISEETP